MSAESRYRRERPWAAQVVDTHEGIGRRQSNTPDMDPQDAIPGAQFAVAFAILDLSDAIREMKGASRMTIPQHLIDKVVRAWIINEGRDPDDPCEEWKYTGYADDARVALETVAADIWQTGYNFGSSDEITRALGIITDDQRTPNPYKRIEHA